MKYLVGLLLGLQVALVVSVYVIAIQEGYLESPKLYLSSAFRQDPARAIAGFILPLTSMIYGVIVSHRLWYLYSMTRDVRDSRFYWVACFALGCAVFGMIGVSAVSLDVSKLIHWLAASVLFLGSGLLMCMLTLLDRRLKVVQPHWLMIVKISLTSLSILSVVLMGSAAFFSYLVGSVFELILAACLVAYLVALVHDSSFPIVVIEKIPRSPRPSGREIKDDL